MNCIICREEYVNSGEDKAVPNVLLCGHTMCKVCIDSIQVKCSSDQICIKCPVCRRQFFYNNTSPPKNYDFIKILDKGDLSKYELESQVEILKQQKYELLLGKLKAPTWLKIWNKRKCHALLSKKKKGCQCNYKRKRDSFYCKKHDSYNKDSLNITIWQNSIQFIENIGN